MVRNIGKPFWNRCWRWSSRKLISFKNIYVTICLFLRIEPIRWKNVHAQWRENFLESNHTESKYGSPGLVGTCLVLQWFCKNYKQNEPSRLTTRNMMLFNFSFMVSTETHFFSFFTNFHQNKVMFAPMCPKYGVHWDSAGETLGHIYVLLKLIVNWNVLIYFMWWYTRTQLRSEVKDLRGVILLFQKCLSLMLPPTHSNLSYIKLI